MNKELQQELLIEFNDIDRYGDEHIDDWIQLENFNGIKMKIREVKPGDPCLYVREMKNTGQKVVFNIGNLQFPENNNEG